jgi:hypothetical protein
VSITVSITTKASAAAGAFVRAGSGSQSDRVGGCSV